MQLIDFYFQYLATELFPNQPSLLFIPPSTSFLLSHTSISAIETLQSLGYTPCTTTLIVFPINNNKNVSQAGGGSHWSLLVYNTLDNTFYHYDSCSNMNESAALELATSLQQRGGVVHSSSKVEWCRHTPQQSNNYDCGVHVLMTSRLIGEAVVGSRDSSKDMDLVAVFQQREDDGVVVMELKTQSSEATLSFRKALLQLIQQKATEQNKY
jgi:sentrin-specific protease 8